MLAHRKKLTAQFSCIAGFLFNEKAKTPLWRTDTLYMYFNCSRKLIWPLTIINAQKNF